MPCSPPGVRFFGHPRHRPLTNRGAAVVPAAGVDGGRWPWTARPAAARLPDGSRAHLFSMVDHDSGIRLGQVNSHGKGHEIAAFRTLLDRIDLTADALHHAALARELPASSRWYYVLTVKRNPPKLYDQLAELPWDQVPVVDQCVEKGHGRPESRTPALTAVGAGIGFPTPSWPDGSSAPAERSARTRTVVRSSTW